MKRVAKNKLALDRNVVKILGPGPLRHAIGGDEVPDSKYPACPTTHTSLPEED